MNQKGFSLIEAVLAAGIFGICVVAVFSFVTFYTKLAAGVHKEQKLFAEADSLLEAFRSKEFCNQQMSSTWPGFPGKPFVPYPKTEDNFFILNQVNYSGHSINLPDASFPGFAEGFIQQIDLKFNPSSDPLVQSALLTIYFYLQSSKSMKRRSATLFFSLDSTNRLTSCIDIYDLIQLDWQQIVCKKVGEDVLHPDGTCIPQKEVEDIVCKRLPHGPKCRMKKGTK